MSIKQSVLYQAIRNKYYDLKEWPRTEENIQIEKSLKRYKNKHKGEICFVIGNGPSLTAADLTSLYRLKIPTFACNRINLIFPQTEWRPTYYFISDQKIMDRYTDEVEGVPEDHRFFPKQYREKVEHGLFYNTFVFNYEQVGKFSKDAGKGVYAAASVTTEMIQFAYYMGFSEIYLIGVDFSYAVNHAINDRTYSYQGEKNYFVEGYLKEGEIADRPNITANLLGFHAAREAIESENRIIMNATRGGKLEVFQRVDLDALLKRIEEASR